MSNDNNNNNNHDDIYSAVIMNEVIARVHSVRLVNVEQRQAAADPQTKPPDLGCESACFRPLSSTTTIAYLLLRPAPLAGALCDDARLTSDVCPSRTSGLSREQRGLRKTKIGIDVANVTRDSDTTFKVKRSKVNLQGAGGILWRPLAQLVITQYSSRKLILINRTT